jgi:transposase InsO family protein
MDEQIWSAGVITSDRGTQFTSSLWAALCSLLNIQHSQMTAYHPQSNGMVERFHRRLKDGSTATQAVFSSPLILPGQFLDSLELASKNFLEQFSRAIF